MALYLTPSGPIFDPPALVQLAPSWALRGAVKDFLDNYQPPKSSCAIFNEKSTDHGPSVRQAIIAQLLFAKGSAAATAYVNSVQQGSITIGSGTTSNTATISAVGAEAFIVYQGQTSTDSSTSQYVDILCRLALTNSTTVMATRNSSTADTPTIKFSVVDPTSALVSGVQAGTVTVTNSGTPVTATITSVSTSLSAVFFLGQSTAGSTFGGAFADIVLTNSTTVTATVGSNGSGVTISFVVVTFQSGVINSMQSVRTTFTSNVNASNSATITSVVVANTMLAYGGFSSTAFNGYGNVSLSTSTSIAYNRGNSTSTTFSYSCTVIEFVSGILAQSAQRSTITLNNVTSNTATITSVTTSKTVLSYLLSSAVSSAPNSFLSSAVLTNSTTVTANLNTAIASNNINSFEAISFN